jgi:hypothetical protein
LAAFLLLSFSTLSAVETSNAAPTIAGQLWSRTISTPNVDFAGGADADQSGSLYVTGDTFGQLAEPSAGGYDGFVAKYDPNGNQVWIHQFGGSSQDASSGIAVNATGDLVVAGSAGGTFGGPSLGSTDGFVRKYNASGTVQWTTRVGSALIDNAVDVALTASGDSFVAGYSFGLTPYQGNGFVTKLSPTGEIAWTRSLTSSGVPSAYGVAVDGVGASFVVGQSPTTVPLNGSNESGGAFVTKFDPNGNLLWARQFGDTSALAYDVAVDLLGNAFIAGQGFVRKLAADGSFLWDRQLGSNVSVTDISLDGLGHVFVGGSGGDVPFYGIYGEDGASLGIHSLQIQSGYAANIAPDGLGHLYISQTVQESNNFDVQLWKVAVVPEPQSLALSATGALIAWPLWKRRR